MKALSLQKMRQEPLNSGIIAGFSTLCAIAIVNLLGSLFPQASAFYGVFLLSVAIIAAVAAGAIASFRSKKQMIQRQAELTAAKSLAAGDFSNAIWGAQDGRSEIAAALREIADRQLAIERSNGQLIQEGATRESQLISALDCLGQEITVFDRSGLLVCANSAYLSKCNTIGAVIALGMTRKEVWAELARAPLSNLPINERQSWFKFQEDMRNEAVTTKAPVRFTRFDGEQAQMFIQTTKDGHHVEIIESIEERSKLEQRMQKAEREANAMGRIKQVTLSRLSHTIRTPMTGVLAAAELLSDSALDDKQRARVDIIRRSAGTLLGVVQDMFEMAETTSVEVEARQANLSRKQALVCSSPAHLAKAAIEIMANSDFEVTTFEPAEANDAWKIAVEIHADVIVVASEAQKSELLAAATTVVSSQRPELKLFSELLVPATNPEATIEVLETSTEVAPRNVKPGELLDLLIVESNEVNQIYLNNSLQKSEFAFKIVGTGALAIETAKTGKPRLILVDISIPDIDGLKVTSAIRTNTSGDLVPPIVIGMTNHFVQGDLAKCLNAGMDHYMAKPQTAETLQELISGWLKPEPLKKAG